MMSNWTYIVLLGAVVAVASLFLPRKQQGREAKDTRNMEIALEQFMENTELDHQELVKLVSALREEGKQQTEAGKQRLAELENKCLLLEQQLAFFQQQRQNDLLMAAQTKADTGTAKTAPLAEELPPVVQENEQPASGIQLRYPDLFDLYNQGKSIEAIAKKLGMNKGEVQLILQLAKQEEKAYV
ncbi:DUF6115 domain-containing protein [Paenibacillus glycanilyticus]|uniref:DUF2802 domain-containing protein n=1 Tax=Paenibacillus glycanilyticus TaxID=126569 RepID=A0ABQ6NVS9_9BACL|nr:hypothetical protein [Paenibacillus glycanilyticus]GMK48074.1 hypothetical protein PghCCS26_52040 [Paenibacillus glycanilyticus]